MGTEISGSTGIDKIQNNAVDIADLSATGTASASTFLRGDNAWTDALPTQSGNAGKFLTTDASTASWAEAGGAYEILDVVNVTSSTASALVATGMSTAYRKYKVAFACKSPADGAILRMRGRKAGVVQTGTNYTYASYSLDTGGATTINASAGGDTSINLSGGWGLHGPNEQFHGEIDFADVYSDGYYRFHWSSAGRRYGGAAETDLIIGAGSFDSGGTWDGFQFFYSSGDIQTGRFFLLGQKGA